jgi:hypothetical protein
MSTEKGRRPPPCEILCRKRSSPFDLGSTITSNGNPAGGFLKSRLGLAVAAMLCVAAPANAEIVEVDFTSNRGSGFFDVDLTNFVIPSTAANPTSFDVVAADINLTDPGWLFGQLHYGINNVQATHCTPAECSVTFRTQVFIPGFGFYNPTLQLNFDKIWVPWVSPDQQKIFMSFTQEGFFTPQNWFDVGDVQRVESAVSEPSTWAMMILGFCGLGFMAYRRKNSAPATGASLWQSACIKPNRG